MNTDKLRYHNCKEAGETYWTEYDARGIPLGRVCKVCMKAKLSKYRPEVLTNPNYDTFGETIEEEQ